MKTELLPPSSSPLPARRAVAPPACQPAASPTFWSAGGTPRLAASWHPAGRRLESLRYSRQECLRYDRAAFTRLELLALDVMPGQPLLFVSGDYNVSVGQYHHQCSSGVTDAAALLVNPSADGYRWLPGPHGDSGNLLLADGQVLQTSSESLRRYLDVYIRQQHDNGVYHLLKPRP